jgi:DNA-binding transcriptional regulator LsrR (DeoR family)
MQAGKLAKLLLSWTPPATNGAKEIRVRSGLTHEEMAQMIGASRETVTRLLSDLKKKQLIRLFLLSSRSADLDRQLNTNTVLEVKA